MFRIMIKLYATDRFGGSDTAFSFTQYLYASYRRKGDNMTETQIIQVYADRRMTIREIAKASGRSYANVRKVLTGAGYHFSKKI